MLSFSLRLQWKLLFSSSTFLLFTPWSISQLFNPLLFLIPRLDSTVFSKCLVDRLGECDSAAETTAHLLSFSYPLLISLSPFYCRSNSFISVLTEAHFRWSVLLRHIPFSSARMRFFFPHILQGPLTLRFIVSVEAEVDCFLSVMYFH